MNEFHKWAHDWGINPLAINDLIVRLTPHPATDGTHRSEAAVQQSVRLEAAAAGVTLWRNNVGAVQTETGMIRYGIANDTPAMNKRIKSSDLVGIRPGGQFIAREIKASGWRYSGTEREEAQLRFIILVNAMGGDAGFATGVGTI